MVALPIASTAIILLFSGLYSAQSYITASSRSQAEEISLYYKSQVAVSLIQASQPNYGQAIPIIQNFSRAYSANVTLMSLCDIETCQLGDVCRIVTLSSKTYVLIVSR